MSKKLTKEQIDYLGNILSRKEVLFCLKHTFKVESEKLDELIKFEIRKNKGEKVSSEEIFEKTDLEIELYEELGILSEGLIEER